MENNDEKILKNFLEEANIGIEDNHFSDRVMRQLPAKKQKTGWIVPVFTLLGIVLSFLIVDVKPIVIQFLDILAGIPIMYKLGAVMAFPILTLVYYIYYEREKAL